MDAFLGLYDNGSSSSDDDWDIDSGVQSCSKNLPPEPQNGNVEYKLKLTNPSSQRFEHLVTQVPIPQGGVAQVVERLLSM